MLLVLWQLRAPELQRFAQACRATRDLVEAEQHRMFNVYDILRPFFPDPDDFRLLQARTGLLVSGSQVLQLLDRVSYGPTDLDLYIRSGVAHIAIDWLIYHGYKLTYRSATTPGESVLLGADILNARFGTTLVDDATGSYFLRPGQILFKFEKGPLRNIDLIVTLETPFACVLDFHGST
ncbi:hypothetical protein AURDEDRAFT_70104 [Auricularia subglabra TFB-10046 SS5]|nr:hypothetical protein AURDEDRAFT_70104 [Auricularia subglabra TFB-10046 SS5]